MEYLWNSNVWDNKKEHERNAEWLRELIVEKGNMKQNDINIITEMIKEQVKKIPIGKAQDQMKFWVTG